MTNTPASDANDDTERAYDNYGYYDEYGDWYEDDEDSYDPDYDYERYEDDDIYDDDSDDYEPEPITGLARLRGELAFWHWKVANFVRDWTGKRLRNRFRRCPECGKRNRAYWSYNDSVCSDCEIPF